MRKTPWLGLIAALALARLGAQQPAPDLILTNGKIITVDERFTIAQALAIRGDRIVAVGSSADIARLAGPNTRRTDLAGRAVIPGLIDNHIHLLRAANTWARELRFDGIESRKRAVEMLQTRVKAAGPGEWVYNIGGWAHQQFSDDPKPFTREELDRIAPGNPVALQESYYQVFLNSRALEILGIKTGAPDPGEFVKGSIQRDAQGNPTGVVRGDIAATRPIANRFPRVPQDQLEAASQALIQDMNRAGLTSFGVPGCDAGVLDILRKWKTQERLTARIFCIDGAGAATPEQASTLPIQKKRYGKCQQGDAGNRCTKSSKRPVLSVSIALDDVRWIVDSERR